MLFKNKLVLNEEYIHNFFKLYYLKSKQLKGSYILMILLVIFGIINLFLSKGEGDIYLNSLLIGVPIVLLFILYFTYKKNIKISIQRQKEQNLMDAELETEFHEEYIFLRNKKLNAEQEFNYDIFEQCVENKRYFIMYTKARIGVTVDKNNFKKGDIYALKEFLKTKCPKMKIK